MDTNLHACGCEVNQNNVTIDAMTEVKNSSDILGPKMVSESISENQIFIKFSWESMPPDPPSFICVLNIHTHL